ncbi:FMN-binding negative transcriptional regulator [Burkholderia sp. SIMBA_043]|uniref:FMN-binding negative transcriptional regulator n=1 Tax=Burkholderia TaxID=32008 RepID=UPI0005D76A31|nr:FMN-binding negative transcriptional regulator [Burkholderia vietnamiensis]AJY03783.1 putative FMN-binding domain protein [Burkholderia vietnamiensis LMG 10929]AVR12984.1 FMN-binding negative transcriptional regulator [Burkholderia vietnamiensis]KVM55317.1 transcriptional regulator [Burkholderia vietnamiensis]KVS06851.1 transcriptional regulator [Burkholderia vietnamiensis]UBI23592.1 FMN-binding negative transcriptional regulator [Burkholderia vietnamiensis]
MYVPADFAESNPDALRELIVQHPFGSLVTHGASGLDANHLPFELLPRDGGLGELHAHVARANPLWQEVANGDDVLVIFRAGDAYISPNWYPSKHVAHRQVPTWNYVVVHAYGRITVRDDEKFVRGVVARLTRTHEASQPVPWKMADAPKDYLDALLQSIVGLQIEITRLVGKRKLSQTKAADALIANGQVAIGDAMLEQADAKRQ